MATLEDARKLCALGEVSGSVRAQDIINAQAELGVEFPKEYREFVEEFGAVLADGVEVFGIVEVDEDRPPLWQNVVSVTKQLREWGQAGADNADFVPVSEDGSGVYFFMNTAVSPDTEIWAIGPGIEKIVASSFYRFIIDFSKGDIPL